VAQDEGPEFIFQYHKKKKKRKKENKRNKKTALLSFLLLFTFYLESQNLRDGKGSKTQWLLTPSLAVLTGDLVPAGAFPIQSIVFNDWKTLIATQLFEINSTNILKMPPVF
jgi:hypothetical protein